MNKFTSTYAPTYEDARKCACLKARKSAYLLVFFTYEEMCVHVRRCARTRLHGFKDGHKWNKSNKYADLRAKAGAQPGRKRRKWQPPPKKIRFFQHFPSRGDAEPRDFASGCIFQTVSKPAFTMTKPLSQNAIGRMMNPPMSSASMTKMRKAGCPMDSVASVEAWRKEHLNVAWCKPALERAPGHVDGAAQTGGGGGLPRGRVESFNSARTREKIAEAELAEIEVARVRGLYLVKADFERHLFTAGRMLRDTLTNCARRIGAEVAGMTSPEDCEAVIDREHRTALASFSQNLHQSLKLDIGPVQASALGEVQS